MVPSLCDLISKNESRLRLPDAPQFWFILRFSCIKIKELSKMNHSKEIVKQWTTVISFSQSGTKIGEKLSQDQIASFKRNRLRFKTISLEWCDLTLTHFFHNFGATLWKRNHNSFRVVHVLTMPLFWCMRIAKWIKIEVPLGTSILVQFSKLIHIRIEPLDYFSPQKLSQNEVKIESHHSKGNVLSLIT